jgi:uncharacterized protein YdcH (DUF465 family)
MQDNTAPVDVEDMISEHRELDEKAHQLADRRILSLSERIKLKSLKVKKLRLKDAICRLQGGW